MMWLNNLQPGSYKGIAFDVVTLDDSNEKALAEHARPFVNGMDLEDMGTLGHITRVTAVYYGLGFDRKLLTENGNLKSGPCHLFGHNAHHFFTYPIDFFQNATAAAVHPSGWATLIQASRTEVP